MKIDAVRKCQTFFGIIFCGRFAGNSPRQKYFSIFAVEFERGGPVFSQSFYNEKNRYILLGNSGVRACCVRRDTRQPVGCVPQRRGDKSQGNRRRARPKRRRRMGRQDLRARPVPARGGGGSGEIRGAREGGV